jgi:hypothetical protein
MCAPEPFRTDSTAGRRHDYLDLHGTWQLAQVIVHDSERYMTPIECMHAHAHIMQHVQ